jgi:hypothetical protein
MFNGSVVSTLQGYDQLGNAAETGEGSLEMLLSGAKSDGEKGGGAGYGGLRELLGLPGHFSLNVTGTAGFGWSHQSGR